MQRTNYKGDYFLHVIIFAQLSKFKGHWNYHIYTPNHEKVITENILKERNKT